MRSFFHKDRVIASKEYDSVGERKCDNGGVGEATKDAMRQDKCLLSSNENICREVSKVPATCQIRWAEYDSKGSVTGNDLQRRKYALRKSMLHCTPRRAHDPHSAEG